MHHSLLIAVLFVLLAPFAASAATASSTAAFNASTLMTKDTTPSITGTSTEVSKVRVRIENAKGSKVFESKDMKVKKDGSWRVNVNKKLKDGIYDITLYGPKAKLATSTLTIGELKGVISVAPIALLAGGSAAAGSSIPVAYIQVKNLSAATTSISGFELMENGSAPDSVVTGFSTSDDKGGSRATMTDKSVQFKKGKAFVPLAALLGPGQIRIFTLKAILSPMSGLDAGSNLKVDVTGVKTGATIRGTLPMTGVTWVLR